MIATLAFAAALDLAALPRTAPVLLDSRCGAEEWAGAARATLDAGVTLLAQHDADFIYLCLLLPQGSFGSLDLFLQGPQGDPVNLHVSAQVGERTRTAAGWPDWRFGQHDGWYGPPVPFGGMRTGEDAQPEVRWRDSSARELQLSRRRFGDGPWKMRIVVEALGPNQEGRITVPVGSSENEPPGWATLRLGG